MSYKTFSRLSIGLPILSFLIFVAIFGTGVPHDFPVAVIDADNTSLSRKLVRMVDATQSAAVTYEVADMAEAEKLIKSGKADAVVYIPKNFEKDIYSTTQTDVALYINGLNLTKNGLLNRDLQTAITTFSSGIKIQMLMKSGMSEAQAYSSMMPIYYEKHLLFNPYTNYSYYLLPTFLPLMLMLFVLLTTIFTVGIELKNGTAAEWLACAKEDMSVALTGKLLPYTFIFYAIYLFMNTVLFKFMGVPLQGSATLIFVSGAVYIIAYQALGLAIIALLGNMRLALSLGGGYSVLAFTFCGLTFPFLAMDPLVRAAGYIFPLTFYVDIFIDQAMRAAPVTYSLHHLGFMMLFLLIPLFFTRRLRRMCTEPKYWGKI